MFIGAKLTDELRNELIEFLIRNKTNFAWSHANMVGISPETITHKLNVNPEARPVKQKR